MALRWDDRLEAPRCQVTYDQGAFGVEPIIVDWSGATLGCSLHPILHRVEMQLLGGGFEAWWRPRLIH
jgi:hypothetical protein